MKILFHLLYIIFILPLGFQSLKYYVAILQKRANVCSTVIVKPQAEKI